MLSKHFKILLLTSVAIIAGSFVLILATGVANPQSAINLPFDIGLTLLFGTVAGLSVLGIVRERERALTKRAKRIVHSSLSPLIDDMKEIQENYRNGSRELSDAKGAVNDLKADHRDTMSHIYTIESQMSSLVESTEMGNRKILNHLRKGTKQEAVLHRLQAAENRLLAAFDASSFDHSDQLGAIADELAKRKTLLHETLDKNLSPLRELTLQNHATIEEFDRKLQLLVEVGSQLTALEEQLHTRTGQAEEFVDNLTTRMHEGHTEALAQAIHDGAASIRSHVTSEATDLLRQVEALLQLTPRVDASTRRLPASGGWAMSAEGLLLLSDLIVQRRPRKIVELGSGSSTIWMGLFAKQCASSVTTVEHDRRFADKTTRLIHDFGLNDTVELRIAELTKVTMNDRSSWWYDPRALEGLDEIDMLIVDGPPKATGPEARRPALSMLIDLLAPDCIVILDDMQRKEERTIFSAWQEAYPDFKPQDTGSPRVGILHRQVPQ